MNIHYIWECIIIFNYRITLDISIAYRKLKDRFSNSRLIPIFGTVDPNKIAHSFGDTPHSPIPESRSKNKNESPDRIKHPIYNDDSDDDPLDVTIPKESESEFTTGIL